jgi:adenylate cyclase
MKETKTISNWLLTSARSLSGYEKLMTSFCQKLRDEGIPLDRATLGVPILHPIAQSCFCAWDLEHGVRINSLVWDKETLGKLRNSPMHSIYTKGLGVDWVLDSTSSIERYTIGKELHDAGYNHYVAYALPFSDGSHKAMTIQTKSKGGFTYRHRTLVENLIPEISVAVEHFAQRELAQTLVNTFVGNRAGELVLQGNVHRGDGEFIEAVIWMSDLRGFTRLAMSEDPKTVLEAINTYFEVVTNEVHTCGGEVLKFIGDAVLAAFPADTDKTASVANAEAAVKAVLARKDTAVWPDNLDFGIGLHLGEVFFGNVGARDRLDFTVIGQAVNLVSRIESLCREVGANYLATQSVVDLSNENYELVGARNVKGVNDPVKIFRLPGI